MGCVEELFFWSSGDLLPSKSMGNGTVPVFGGNGITAALHLGEERTRAESDGG